MKNRIHVVNWRKDGDAESYVKLSVYSANDDSGNALEEALAECEVEEGTEENPTYYVNDDLTIEDGEMVEHNGKKFRVCIQEVAE